MTDPFAGVRLSAIPPLPAAVRLGRPTARAHTPPGDLAERRSSVRRPVREDVLIRPMRADGSAAGRVVRGVVTEISDGGLRLFCGQPIPPGLAAVRFGDAPGAPVRFVALARTRKVPSGYEYAGPFAPVTAPADAAR